MIGADRDGDGGVKWLRKVDGGIDFHDVAAAIGVDSTGDVVAAGGLADGVLSFDQRFAAVKLSGSNGGGYPLIGSSFKLRDTPPRPRKLTLASTDRTLEIVTPVSASDPTIGGATLEVTNPTTTEQATMSLPAGGWTALGTPPGLRGYRYADREQALGPCTAAKMDSRRTKIRCSGPGVAFSLDERARVACASSCEPARRRWRGASSSGASGRTSRRVQRPEGATADGLPLTAARVGLASSYSL